MTHPDDITAYLKARLEDRNPKCANCKHWKRDTRTATTLGECSVNSFSINLGAMSNFVPQYTTDLSLCSAWEKKE